MRVCKQTMQTSSPHSRSMRDYTSIPFETFIGVFSVVPFLVLAYFYPLLPERVPLFLNLSGEVETWAAKGILSVFRVPLMAVVTQLVCLLMKYGVVQSQVVAPVNLDGEQQYLRFNAGLWDWFRWAVAIKMSAASLDTIFLSLDRFKFLSRPAFIVSAVAAGLGVVGALFYGYRLLVVRREMKREFVGEKVEPVDARHVYGRVFYFNPTDSALFVDRYIFNLGNKWVWVFIACLIAYPLLAFWPA